MTCIFDFFLFTNTHHYHELLRVKHSSEHEVKQAPNSMMETLRQLGILWCLVKA